MATKTSRGAAAAGGAKSSAGGKKDTGGAKDSAGGSEPASTKKGSAGGKKKARGGRGKMIAAAAGVAAATAAGVAAAKVLRGRSKGGGKGKAGGKKTVVYHVVPRGEEWQVKKQGADRASGTYGNKKEAVSAGREIANRSQPSRLVIHGSDGAVQTSHNYGEDAG